MTLIMLPQDALTMKAPFGFSVSERKHIDEMCKRITAFGLLSPLTVTRDKGRFVIVDGKKRFQAIKKLAKMNKLPRTLHKVPCTLNDNSPLEKPNSNKPILFSEQDLVNAILSADKKGCSCSEISKLLDCSEKVITQARSLYRLHAKLMLVFMNNTIDLSQAYALSTLPNKNAQWDLLVKLGPFATEPQIIEAIATGKTVLDLPNGDIMILPSRSPVTFKPSKYLADDISALPIAA